MQVPTRNSLLLTAIIAGALLSTGGCKKEPEPDPTAATAMAADGSGFKDVFSADLNTAGVGGIQGAIGVPDFTLEGTKLHLVYTASTAYQQGAGTQLIRRTQDLATGGIVAQPDGADTALSGFSLPNSEYYRGPTLFLPYRNFFTHNKYRRNGQRLESTFGGDLSFTYSAYSSFAPSLGFRYPVNNLGATNEGAIATGVAPTPPSYLFKTYQAQEAGYGNLSQILIHAFIMESYRHSFQDSIFGIALRQDSIIAYTVSADAAGKLTQFRKAAGIASFPAIPANLRGAKLIRHYDPSGNKMAIAIIGPYTYTFTFDFTTLVLTRGVDNFAMPHNDEYNTDVDDEGNLYYADKTAGFGATTVYKRTPAGVTTVVGIDKPLRYGEIVRVKWLLGKVYIAASGRPGTSEFTHVAVLQQQ